MINDIKLIISSFNTKKNYECSQIINGDITWDTDRKSKASKVTFEIIKNGEIIFHEGDMLRCYVNQEPFFAGFVEKKEKRQERIGVTAYDLLARLKYKQSYFFKKQTCSDALNVIAGEFKLPLGTIEDTEYIMPEKLYDDKSLLDIITDCITVTAIATKKIFVLYDDFGKLSLKEINNLKSRYVIGNASFGLDYTYTTSIIDSYNYIKLVKPNESTGKADAYIAHDQTKVERWGRRQYYAKVDENLNPAQIKEMTKNYLKTYAQTKRNLKLPAVGVVGIRAGSMILVDIEDLGDIALKKMLLIDKCTHKISSSDHKMDLEMRVYNG